MLYISYIYVLYNSPRDHLPGLLRARESADRADGAEIFAATETSNVNNNSNKNI